MDKKMKIIGGIAVISLVLAIIALFSGGTNTVIERVTEQLGGGTNFDTIGLDSSNGTIYFDYERGQLTAAEDQDVFTNNSGVTRFYDFAAIEATATGTAAYRLYVVATSTSSIGDTHDFTALAVDRTDQDFLINWATGTTSAATSTNSLLLASRMTVALVASGGGGGGGTYAAYSDGVVAVPAGHSLIIYQQKIDSAVCADVATLPCLNATSTLSTSYDYFFRWYATSTPN